MKNIKQAIVYIFFMTVGIGLQSGPIVRQEEWAEEVDLEEATLEEFARGIELLMEDFNNQLRNHIVNIQDMHNSPREDLFVQEAFEEFKIKMGVVALQIRLFDCLPSTKELIQTLIGEYIGVAETLASFRSYESLRRYLNGVQGNEIV